MSFLVTDSKTPLQMETLPALKVTHFYGVPARGEVYAYLRCYLRAGGVYFSITVFDETPPATARAGFALTALDDAGRYLFACCSKEQGDSLWLYRSEGQKDVPVRRLPLAPMRHLAGSDEQGFYWSAEGAVPAQTMRDCFGHAPRTGDMLLGNLFLFDTQETAFGAAFPVPEHARGCVPVSAGFEPFVAVPY